MSNQLGRFQSQDEKSYFEKRKNILKKQTLLFLLSLFLIVSCANPNTSSKSDEDTTAESEVFQSGVYYVSGLSQIQTTNSTGASTTYSYSVSGFLYETWEWYSGPHK